MRAPAPVETLPAPVRPTPARRGAGSFPSSGAWAAFGRRSIERELRRLDSLRSAAAETVKAKSVHKMRTTTRRLRVSLRLFADVLPGEVTAIGNEFRWFAQELGGLRDLDVCCAVLRKAADAEDADACLAAYELHLRSARDEARRQLAPLLTSARVDELLWRARALLARCDEHAIAGPASLHERARQHVHAAARRLLKRGRRIDQRSHPEELHRLRIRDKRFRYELELLSEIFPEPLLDAAKAARKLQDFLGRYQDACMACERLRHYAQSQDSRRAGGELPALLRAQERRRRAIRARFPDQWRRFEKTIARDWRKAVVAS